MRSEMNRRRRKTRGEPFRYEDPYREAWLELTPAQRLGRAWRLRSRLKDPQAIHDAKTFPKL
jgi:hypothetical protein